MLFGGEFATLVLALVPTVAPGEVSDGAGFLAWLNKFDEQGQAPSGRKGDCASR